MKAGNLLKSCFFEQFTMFNVYNDIDQVIFICRLAKSDDCLAAKKLLNNRTGGEVRKLVSSFQHNISFVDGALDRSSPKMCLAPLPCTWQPTAGVGR